MKKEIKNEKLTWWDEIKAIAEELSFPIIKTSILVIEIILAIAYIAIILIAVTMIINTLLSLT